jgi:hypothetical protein
MNCASSPSLEWVRGGSRDAGCLRPVIPQVRTSNRRFAMSEKRHQRTLRIDGFGTPGGSSPIFEAGAPKP